MRTVNAHRVVVVVLRIGLEAIMAPPPSTSFPPILVDGSCCCCSCIGSPKVGRKGDNYVDTVAGSGTNGYKDGPATISPSTASSGTATLADTYQ